MLASTVAEHWPLATTDTAASTWLPCRGPRRAGQPWRRRGTWLPAPPGSRARGPRSHGWASPGWQTTRHVCPAVVDQVLARFSRVGQTRVEVQLPLKLPSFLPRDFASKLFHVYHASIARFDVRWCALHNVQLACELGHLWDGSNERAV